MIKKYRKKPVEIEALQWTGENRDEIVEFCKDLVTNYPESSNIGFGHDRDDISSFYIKTLEGIHEAKPGDWIIKGVKGEFYPCKSDIFEMTYELV